MDCISQPDAEYSDMLVGGTSSAIALLDAELKLVRHNTACRRLFAALGLPDQSADGFADIVFTDADGLVLGVDDGPIGRARDSGRAPETMLCGLVSAHTQSPLWSRITTVPRHDGDGVLDGYVVTLTDAAPEMHLRATLRAESENLRQIVINTPVGICVTDHRGMFEFANPAYLAFYDYRADELIGNHFTQVVPLRWREVLSESHDRFIAGAGEIRGEWTVMDRSGRERDILADATRIVDERGNPKKVTFIIDISERKQLELELKQKTELLERLSTTDALTGLHNRRHADAVLSREVSRAGRTEKPLTIALIDIDRFKTINDRFGHPVGDKVLVGVASALRSAFRETDTLARYGGEEFLVILPYTSSEQAVEPMRRARDQVVRECMPHLAEAVTFSGGLTDYRPGESAQDLLLRADRMLYRAKAEGRDRVLRAGLHDPAPETMPS